MAGAAAGENTEIEKLCFRLCDETLSSEQQIKDLQTLKEKIESEEAFKDSEWKNDITSLLAQLTSSHKAVPSLIMVTDDPQDLLLSGTEVLGSCQRIDGNLSFSKCLLSYCLDGKIQMVAIKEASGGRIQARALTKLLFIEETAPDGSMKRKPALFLERTYPRACSEEQETSIKQMAFERAKELGLELYHYAPKGGAKLISLGSNVPFEYEDGGAGVTNGIYTISAEKVLTVAKACPFPL